MVPGAALVLLVGCGAGSSGTSASSSPTSAPPSSSSSTASPGSPTSTTSPTSAGATPTTTAQTTVHSAKKGEPALYYVPGFQLVDVPAEANVGRAMAKGINTSTPGMARGSSTHAIQKNGKTVALLVEVTIAPRYAKQKTALFAAMKEGAATFAGSGATSKTVTIQTEKVAVASSEGTSNRLVFGWVHNGVMTYTIGDFTTAERDLGAILETQYVNGYLAAAHR